MPKLNLDDRTLRRLVNEPGDYADTLMPGLHFRVRRPGVASWSLVFRIKGHQAQLRKTYGPYPRVPLAQARAQAREDLNAAALGKDPRVRQEPDRLTFAGLAELYLAHLQSHGKRSWRDVQYHLRRDLLPRWAEIPADEVDRAAVLRLRAETHPRGPTVAGTLTTLVSAIYNYGLGEDLVKANPAYRVAILSRAKPGRRWLSDDELRVVIPALLAERRAVFAGVLLARLCLGQRTMETLSMEWQDTEDGWWDLAESVTKNGLPHRVPLIPCFREWVLDRLRPITGNTPWVFASGRREGRIHEVAVTNYAREFCVRAGVDFDPRDLRRTYITHLAILKVARETRQRLVNHRGGLDVIDVHYDRYDYDDEKFAAAMVWEGHLRRLLDPAAAKVIPIRA